MGQHPAQAAEEALIGAVLRSGGEVLDELHLDPEDFYHPRYESLWRMFLDIHAKGISVDLVVAGQSIARHPQLKTQITPAELHTMQRDTMVAGNAGYYAAIVAGEATRRRLRTAADAIRQKADEIESIEELVELARQDIDGAAKINSSRARPIGATIMDTVRELKQKAHFIPTPWDGLNHLIGGFRPGALYVIGARPGQGKSIMGVQSAIHMTDYGAVSLSTLEMPERDIHRRILAQKAKAHMSGLMDSDLNDRDMQRVEEEAQNLLTAPLYVDDRSNANIGMVKAQARTVSRHGTLSGIVVDYLQLMEGTKRSTKDRHLEVGEMSRGLKILARDMNVPVIALSQLNRESESRQNKMPTMSDLRESGAIEQDADVIILLHREHHLADELNVGVVKNRHGATGAFTLGWRGQYSMITD